MGLTLVLLGLVFVLLIALEVKHQCGRLYRSVEKMFDGPRYWPFLGNTLTFWECDSLTFHPTVQRICNQYERFTRLWLGRTATILIHHVEDVEVLLTSNEITKSYDYDNLTEWLGTGLLLSTGGKWKDRRRILTPAFHFKILEDFIPVFHSNGDILLEKLSKHAGKGTFNIYDYINLYALDAVSETALGVKINAQKESESKYIRSLKELGSAVSIRPFQVWLANDFIFSLTKIGKIYKRSLKVLHETTERIIKSRREYLSGRNPETEDNSMDEVGQKKRLAFLDILISSGGMKDSDVREEVDTFMFEGHDTVTSGISFLLYSLAHHPNIQESVHREQVDIFGDSDREITMNDLKDMKYLEMVVKESLRHYPSVPIYGRIISNDLKLRDGYFLPKGCQCYVNVRKLHMDPSVWPEPEKFNPNNFLQEAVRNRNPYAYVPFSAGLRNCIGQKYAMMVMKSCVSQIVRKFKLLPSSDDANRIQLTGQLVLFSVNGVNIEIENRK